MGILRLIAVGAFGLVVLLIITSNAQSNYQAGLLPVPAVGSAAVVEALSPEENFLATGVLTFYRRNGVLGPWLLYERRDSTVITKALVFANESICDTGVAAGSCGPDALWLANVYGGGQVRVTGIETGEHVVVERMSPASAPDERVALVQANLEKSATALGVTIVPRFLGGDAQVALVRAEIVHDGIAEEMVFEQGTLVKVGQRQVTLTHARGGAFYFAIASDK